MIPPIDDSLVRLSRWIDGSYGPELCAEAVDRRRIDKCAEEVGEVISAYGSHVGENPRKERIISKWKVEEELLDVATSALGALVHLRGNRTDHNVMEDLELHLERLLKRAGIHPSQVHAAQEKCGDLDCPAHSLSRTVLEDDHPVDTKFKRG